MTDISSISSRHTVSVRLRYECRCGHATYHISSCSYTHGFTGSAGAGLNFSRAVVFVYEQKMACPECGLECLPSLSAPQNAEYVRAKISVRRFKK